MQLIQKFESNILECVQNVTVCDKFVTSDNSQPSLNVYIIFINGRQKETVSNYNNYRE